MNHTSGAAVGLGLAVIALVLGAVQMKRKKTPKTVGILFLLAGAGIAGGAGLAGNFLRKAGNLIGTATNVGTAKVFGVAVPAALVAGVLLWMFHDLHPKTKKPSAALPWLALILPVLLAAAGGVWAGVGGRVVGGLGNTASDLASAFVTGW
jgi:hypothetical protein